MTDERLLPPGAHRCSTQDIFDRFVRDAPYRDLRKPVWDAFCLWSAILWDMFPGAAMWVDGGFVTHKEWAAPVDIDVVVWAKQSEVDRVMTPRRRRELMTDLGSTGADGDRTQPMGGLLDGFVAPRGNDYLFRYWHDKWSRVKGPDGRELEGQRKGYLVVKP